MCDIHYFVFARKSVKCIITCLASDTNSTPQTQERIVQNERGAELIGGFSLARYSGVRE